MTDIANKVAVIGAGIMGSAIATRLIATGNFVTIFDLDRERVAALVEKGGHAAASVAAATGASDFVILSLNHANIVRAVVFGDQGVASAATPAALESFLKSEIVKWDKIIKDAGITPQ